MSNEVAPRQLVRPRAQAQHSPWSAVSGAKVVEAVGDNWLPPNNSKMQTHTFHITEKQLSNLVQSRERIDPFQTISALVWKSMAKIKGTKIITVCRRNYTKNDDEIEMPSNAHQVIGVVEAEAGDLIAEADLLQIAKLISEKFVDETGAMEGVLDFVVYGANLTFVNMEGVDLYGLQLKGRRPEFGSVSVGGVGEEGAVVVAADAGGGGGRIVNVILPEDELQQFRNHLRLDWAIL